MPITPDTKDWTWVLDGPCPDCGFDASSVAIVQIPGLVRRNAAAWVPVLQRPTAAVRPDDSTWSDLEYAAHVRDVFRTFHGRLQLMVTSDEPSFDNWDQDATATAERYQEQDPAVVARELTTSAEAIAAAFEQVRPDQHGRTGTRSDGHVFTVVTLGRYFMHDPVHHLHDVKGF